MVAMPRNAGLKLGTNFITDHNRGSINTSVDRIEKSDRMANGTLRKYVIADKRTWSVSWNDVPGPTAKTVDGNWGADAIETFYNSNRGAFTFVVTTVTGINTYTAMFTDFSKVLTKRGAFDFYDLSFTVTEV